MSSKIIYNFLKKLKCNNCGSSNKIININLIKNRIKSGKLKCRKCNLIVSIEKGVINLDPNTNSLNSHYKKYWNLIPEKFKYERNTHEKKMFKNFFYYFKNCNILDAGCGNGRLFESLIPLKPKLIVGTDLSYSIYIAAKKYKNKFNKIPMIFVYHNIENQFIEKKFFDTVISLGTINFKVNQSKIIKSLNNMKKKLIILGLVSQNTIHGKVYINMNIIRSIINVEIIYKAVILTLNSLTFKTNSTIIIRLRNFLFAIFEIVLSPKIIRKKNSYYFKFFKKVLLIKKHKFIDYIFAK